MYSVVGFLKCIENMIGSVIFSNKYSFQDISNNLGDYSDLCNHRDFGFSHRIPCTLGILLWLDEARMLQEKEGLQSGSATKRTEDQRDMEKQLLIYARHSVYYN